MSIPVFTPPLSLTYSQTRTPTWKTLHQVSVSGRDNPLALWTYPKYQYVLPFSVLRTDLAYLTQQYVLAFYNAVNGSSGVFQYHDPDDGAVTAQEFAIADGTTLTYQLVRAMNGVMASFVEPVLAPVAPTIFINGVATTSFTLAPGGVIVFPTAPGSGSVLTWTGQFNWLCRFNDDTVEFEKFLAGMWGVAKLTFTTIKL